MTRNPETAGGGASDVTGGDSGPAEPFLEIYRAANHWELVFIHHILDGIGARYYVKNEFATIGTLSAVGSDELSVMVDREHAAEGAALIREELG